MDLFIRINRESQCFILFNQNAFIYELPTMEIIIKERFLFNLFKFKLSILLYSKINSKTSFLKFKIFKYNFNYQIKVITFHIILIYI